MIVFINFSYEQLPPGLVKEEQEDRPEDCIPDLPENKAAREFLAKAPTKGLWMPLGKEVKVMKCWRCKAYGHRTGDKECPMFLSGNKDSEQFRHTHEDPMYKYIQQNKTKEKEEKVRQLQALLDSDSSDSDSSSSTSSSSSSDNNKSRHKRKKHSSRDKKRHKKDKRHKKKKRRK